MKTIEITGKELNRSNPYVDFVYDGILYRWYTNEDKFNKVYYLPGDFNKAVRGKERQEVFSQLKNMVAQEEAEDKKSGIINFTKVIEAKKVKEKEAKRIEELKTYFFDLIEGQPQETVMQIAKTILSGDMEAYKTVTEPIIRRKVIYECNTNK